MEKHIASALDAVMRRFAGMQFDEQTLGFMEMEVNDMLYRVYPDFFAEYHICPKYYESERKIRFIPVRKQ
tara:strand:+ start:88009 stop:88218 length:210 start_codon:yes stop_codon:yes gene_type:complete